MQLYHGLAARMLETRPDYLLAPMLRELPRAGREPNSVHLPHRAGRAGPHRAGAARHGPEHAPAGAGGGDGRGQPRLRAAAPHLPQPGPEPGRRGVVGARLPRRRQASGALQPPLFRPRPAGAQLRPRARHQAGGRARPQPTRSTTTSSTRNVPQHPARAGRARASRSTATRSTGECRSSRTYLGLQSDEPARGPPDPAQRRRLRVFCSNYSCGPDSFNLHFFAYVMENKPFAIIETDGHSGDAGTKTRIEAFLYCVDEDRTASAASRAANNSPPSSVPSAAPRHPAA